MIAVTAQDNPQGRAQTYLHDPMMVFGADTAREGLERYATIAAHRIVAALVAAGPELGRTVFLRQLRMTEKSSEENSLALDFSFPRLGATRSVVFRPL